MMIFRLCRRILLLLPLIILKSSDASPDEDAIKGSKGGCCDDHSRLGQARQWSQALMINHAVGTKPSEVGDPHNEGLRVRDAGVASDEVLRVGQRGELDHHERIENLKRSVQQESSEELDLDVDDYSMTDDINRGTTSSYSNNIIKKDPVDSSRKVGLNNTRFHCASCKTTHPNQATDGVAPTSGDQPPQTATRFDEENVRLKYIQKQILAKLRLSSPPNVSVHLAVPPHLEMSDAFFMSYDDVTFGYRSSQRQKQDGRRRLDNGDEFFGTTKQIFVFPEGNPSHCNSQTESTSEEDDSNEETTANDDWTSLCSEMTFKLPKDLSASEIGTAELWLHPVTKSTNVSAAFVGPKIRRHNSRTHQLKGGPDRDGWNRFKATTQIKYWLQQRKYSVLLKFTSTVKRKNKNNKKRKMGGQWSDEPMDEENSVSGLTEGEKFRPFLMVTMDLQKQYARSKRNSDCGPEIEECCREKLFVDFETIGWDDWILQPLGFDAYFCRGSCATITSVTQAESGHASIVQRLSQLPDTSEEVIPCCAPKRMSSISLIYSDEDNVLRNKIIPNMVVESCGCM